MEINRVFRLDALLDDFKNFQATPELRLHPNKSHFSSGRLLKKIPPWFEWSPESKRLPTPDIVEIAGLSILVLFTDNAMQLRKAFPRSWTLNYPYNDQALCFLKPPNNKRVLFGDLTYDSGNNKSIESITDIVDPDQPLPMLFRGMMKSESGKLIPSLYQYCTQEFVDLYMELRLSGLDFLPMWPVSHRLAEHANRPHYPLKVTAEVLRLAGTSADEFRKLRRQLKQDHKRWTTTKPTTVQPDDWVAKLWKSCGRNQDRGYVKLPPPARHVIAAKEYYNEVLNGGHDQYFGNSSGDHLQDAQDGLKAIRATPFLKVLEQALKVFPDPPGKLRDRRRRLDLEKPNFDKLDDRFATLSAKHSIDDKLAKYIEKHQAVLEAI